MIGRLRTAAAGTSSATRLVPAALAMTLVGLTTGCATSATTASGGTPATVALGTLRGIVHGGQQPVVGATVTAYATGATGYGSAARVLGTTTTGAGGAFSLTAYQTCQSTDYVYLVGTGGNPGVTGTQNNSALALMAGLGPCANANQTVVVNEVTTVASVWALAPFMTGAANVGTSATNTVGIGNAFNTVWLKLVNLNTGNAPSLFLNPSASVPVAEINTLADILAACVNTVDATSPAAQSGICQTIFAAAPVGGVAPTNTIQLALNLAKNPTLGLSLYTQATAAAPFQPTLGTTSAPTSWTIAINHAFNGLDPTPNVPKGIAIDPTGYVYSVGAGVDQSGAHYNTLQELSPNTGSMIETHYTGNTIQNQPSALAIDTLGNIWTTDSANNSLVETGPTAPTGGGGIHTGNGMSAPSAVAIDAAGNVWVTNAGNGSVSEFNSAGTAIGNFTTGISAPVAIAIDPR